MANIMQQVCRLILDKQKTKRWLAVISSRQLITNTKPNRLKTIIDKEKQTEIGKSRTKIWVSWWIRLPDTVMIPGDLMKILGRYRCPLTTIYRRLSIFSNNSPWCNSRHAFKSWLYFKKLLHFLLFESLVNMKDRLCTAFPCKLRGLLNKTTWPSKTTILTYKYYNNGDVRTGSWQQGRLLLYLFFFLNLAICQICY